MKYLIHCSILALLILPNLAAAQTQANAIDKYFEQYLNDERFTVVFISARLFDMLGDFDVDGLDMDDREAKAVMKVAQDLRGLRILVSEEDVEELYAEAKRKIDTSEYEILMTVRDKEGQNVEFLVKDNADEGKIEELLLMVGGGDEFVLMSFIGNLDLEKISNLAREMEGN